ESATEVVDAQGGGLDDDVGASPDRLQDPTLASDAVDQAVTALQGMRPSHVVEPFDQLLVGGVEEEDPGLRAPVEQFEEPRQVLVEAEAANIRDDRQPARLGVR